MTERIPPSSSVHATAVFAFGKGLLLMGASGSGKSSLALRLIEMSRLHGRFSTLVGDDRVLVVRHADYLTVFPVQPLEGYAELRGVGILRVPSAPCMVVDAVVQLGERADRLPDTQQRHLDLYGVLLPCLFALNAEEALPRLMALLLPITSNHDFFGSSC